MALTIVPLSSLEKVFPDERPAAPAYTKASCFCNEVFSFQTALYWEDTDLRFGPFGTGSATVEVNSDLPVTVRQVGLMPVTKPTYHSALTPGYKKDYLRVTPGLYPDPLIPVEEAILLIPLQWRSLWFTVDGRQGLPAGRHEITISLRETLQGELLGKCRFHLEVLPQALPDPTLLCTHWFHCDCLADYYGCEAFDERHWQLIERFAKTAADNGICSLLTPVFTPIVDTARDEERPTMQLVDIEETTDGWRFGFERLARWIETLQRAGIRYFEISHFFNARCPMFPPKVVVKKDGQAVKRFGWHTEALTSDYPAFLRAFLPALCSFLQAKGVLERCFFHVSDEPLQSEIERYRACRALLTDYLPESQLMDALSDYDFYETGLCKLPVCDIPTIEPFLENQVHPMWAYYCCDSVRDVPNRFLAQPGISNRIIGTLLYKYQINGFLHWGYNFWYNGMSRRLIDPWKTCEGDYDWPAGDPFLVYPGKDGPVESLRLVQLQEGFQDLRALQALEAKIGYDAVVAMIDEGIEPLQFNRFPHQNAYLLALREKIRAALQ